MYVSYTKGIFLLPTCIKPFIRVRIRVKKKVKDKKIVFFLICCVSEKAKHYLVHSFVKSQLSRKSQRQGHLGGSL